MPIKTGWVVFTSACRKIVFWLMDYRQWFPFVSFSTLRSNCSRLAINSCRLMRAGTSCARFVIALGQVQLPCGRLPHRPMKHTRRLLSPILMPEMRVKHLRHRLYIVNQEEWVVGVASQKLGALEKQAREIGMITGLGTRGPYFKANRVGQPMAHLKGSKR